MVKLLVLLSILQKPRTKNFGFEEKARPSLYITNKNPDITQLMIGVISFYSFQLVQTNKKKHLAHFISKWINYEQLNWKYGMPNTNKMYKNLLSLSSTTKNTITSLVVVNDLKVLHGSRFEAVPRGHSFLLLPHHDVGRVSTCLYQKIQSPPSLKPRQNRDPMARPWLPVYTPSDFYFFFNCIFSAAPLEKDNSFLHDTIILKKILSCTNMLKTSESVVAPWRKKKKKKPY